MKEIKAVVRPNKLPALREALRDIPGFPGMTVSKAEGCSAPSRHVPHNIKEELTDYTPKVRIEIVVKSDDVERCVDAIIKAARTGKIGDGKIFVTPVERVVRIRTGEEDDAAI